MSAETEAVAALFARLRPLTGALRFARPQMREMIDRWLAEQPLPEGPSGFLHALVTGLEAVTEDPRPDPAHDGDALALVLATLGGPDRALACFSAAVAGGLFDAGLAAEAREAESLAGGADRAVESRGALNARAAQVLGPEAARAVLQSSELQAFADPFAFWTDPGHLLPAVLLGRRRMCRVVRLDDDGREVTGSGFLIGPSTVLTNFHVVKGLPDRLDEPGLLRVEFDYSDTTGLPAAARPSVAAEPDWCAAKSETGPTGPGTGFWWYDRALRRAFLDATETTLDYAAIRLSAAPGLQRGWFDIARPVTGAPSGVIVLHHPGQTGQTITLGGVLFPADAGRRIFHLAATAPGSSGGLALDEQGRPIGLHYLGLSTDAARPPDKPGYETAVNVAISLRLIAADLAAKGVAAEIASARGLRPVRGSLDGRRPVFGRETLLAALERVWRGEPQMMTVHVEPRDPPLSRPGKSFTIEVVKALFRAPEHHHIVFRAGEIRVDAWRLACDTVATLAPDLVERLPTAPDTTTPAYVRKLVATLGQILTERLGNRLVWIMLDDLDRHDLTDATGREFLATLYSLIGRMPNLRVILIGLPADISISGIEADNVIASVITAADVGNLTERLTEWLKLRGGRDADITDTGYRLFARTVVSYCGTEQPLQRMADFVANHVTTAADDLFGLPLGEAGVP